MKACVLIPSFNEAETIGRIVKKIKAMGIEVVVIDDGSVDNTENVASENGAIVIRHMKNLGKGASLKKGFEFILRDTDFDAVIIMDGDGQHNPEDIQKFISRARDYGEDIVVGNRMTLTKGMPWVRRVTNRVMSSLLSSVCKQDIPDTQCGFKLITRRILETIPFDCNNYDFDSEILIKASRRHCKVASVPVETIYEGEPSRIHPIKDTLRFMALLAKTCSDKK